MGSINKNVIVNLVWSVVVIIIATALWFFLSREAGMKSDSPAMTSPPSDMVTTQGLTHGNRLITNVTAHYGVIVPLTWYLEKKAGSGVTVYPNYDPLKQNPPLCKIEISLLRNSKRADLDEWLTNYLHEDPTADVIESSRMPSTISGHPTITWTGSLNGISSTLAYISREDGSLYEIAPSLIENGGASDGNRKCFMAFQSLMSNFRILP